MSESHSALRQEVRDFLADERAAGHYRPACNGYSMGWSPELSRKIGARGWIGMTWPTRYGGGGRCSGERLAVVEELVASGAPVAAHWVAERQIGPLLLHDDNEALRERFLPAITRGECSFAVGLSEPQAGSDLAAVQTRADRVPGGWSLTGHKVWTSNAHRTDYTIVLARTEPAGENRRRGLTQFIVDNTATGIERTPVTVVGGRHHFNDVRFTDVFVPDELVVGGVGEGWSHVTAELALERSGPERYLGNFPALSAAAELCPDTQGAPIGVLLARIVALRGLTREIAESIGTGRPLDHLAAMVKEVGSRLDQDAAEAVRAVLMAAPEVDADIRALYEEAVMWSPAYTLRGGATEILRGVIARGMGLR